MVGLSFKCHQCPDVVSFCPFRPPTTTFGLHFIIKSSISIPPALPPFYLFILLLLAGDINLSPGPSNCPKITYAIVRSIHNKYPAIAKFISDNDTYLFAMSETWIRPDTNTTNLSKITHQVTICINSHERSAMVEDWGFSLKMDWILLLFLQKPPHQDIPKQRVFLFSNHIQTTFLQYSNLFRTVPVTFGGYSSHH